MPKITIASLERRILVLESEKQTLGGQLSINGEFQLEAFKMLLERMKADEKPCVHDYYLHVVGDYIEPRALSVVKRMGSPEPVVIDGVLWKPYSVNHIDADGKKFSFYIFCN